MIETLASITAVVTAALGITFLVNGLRGTFLSDAAIGGIGLYVAYEAAKLGGLL